jgi:hypothetical protein
MRLSLELTCWQEGPEVSIDTVVSRNFLLGQVRMF